MNRFDSNPIPAAGGLNRGARTRAGDIMGSRIDGVGFGEAVERICQWAERRESRMVCLCNVHSVVTANHDRALRDAINAADLAAPDGMPVAFALRRAGFAAQERVPGPDLMWACCAAAVERNLSIYLFGSRTSTLDLLQARLLQAFPGLRIAGAVAPPFGPIPPEEEERLIHGIIDSGAGIVFVALGCPKQEIWMARHQGRVPAVMMGVGAAVDFHAGVVRRAPRWMQKSGLEWLHRLASEPRRLAHRYVTTNTRFLLYLAQGAGRRQRSAATAQR